MFTQRKFMFVLLVLSLIAFFFITNNVFIARDQVDFSPIKVSSHLFSANISGNMQMLEDPEGQFSVEQLLNPEQKSLYWQKSANRGYTDNVYWFRVLLQNRSARNVDLMLEIPSPSLDRIDGYLLPDEYARKKRVYASFTLGDQYRTNKRRFLSPNFVESVMVPPGDNWLLLRVETSSVMSVPVFIADAHSFAEQASIQQWISGIMYGVALALACYNLFLFSMFKDKTYLFCCLFIFSMFLFYASAEGYMFLMKHEYAVWEDKASFYFIYIMLVFAIEFSRLFLSISKQQPSMMRDTRALIIFSICCFCLTPFLQEVYAAMVMTGVTGAVLVYLLYLGILRYRDGVPMAGLYVAVWGVMICTALINLLVSTGWFFDIVHINSYLKVISIVELLLLSFGVGSKLNTIRNKQLRAEHHALRFSQEARKAEKKALEVQRDANRTLEAKVKERTRELEDAMEELHHLNDELKRLSETDTLTGLNNRRKFEDCFSKRLDKARLANRFIVFMLADIDFFKKFNDEHGHDVGDLCLIKVATVLDSLAQKLRFDVARFGGEEFAILGDVVDFDEANALAEMVRMEIESSRLPNHEDLRVTVSVGSHVCEPDSKDRSSMMKLADNALYKAKANGRNCVVMDYSIPPQAANH